MFKTSLLLQRPLSFVSKVAVVDRVSTVMTFFLIVFYNLENETQRNKVSPRDGDSVVLLFSEQRAVSEEAIGGL